MAFVLFIFLMASSVLLAGAPLRHAWFMLQGIKTDSPVPVSASVAWLPVITEIAFAVSFMLAGLWFLRHAKGKFFYLLLAVTFIALGPSSSDFSQQLVYPKPDGAERFWFWPVYGLRLLETVVGQLGTSTQTFMLSEELRRANAQLLEARESERQRLRDDLHDGVLGALSGMKMKLGVLEMQQSGDSKSSDLLSGIMRDLEHTQSDVRRLVNGLHASALEALGLHGALEQYVVSQGGLRIELRTEGITSHRLPLEVQAVALRIAQEAITDVIKHARAKRCLVSVWLEATGLLLEIEDDGVGLPVPLESGRAADRVAGQGLRSMRERASRIGGLLEVERGARDLGGGTRVRARLPFALGEA